MDDIVLGYITRQFHANASELIRKAFYLLEQFEDPFDDIDFNNIISSDVNMDTDAIQDSFISLLYKRVDDVISEHKMSLELHTPLCIKVDILTVFQELQKTDQYNYIMSILESNELAIDKLARIICYYTDNDEPTIANYLNDVDEDMLVTMHLYLERQQMLNQDVPNITGAVKSLKELKAHYPNMFLIGVLLFESGINLELTYDKILPFADVYFKTTANKNLNQFILDVISLSVLTKSNNPIKVMDLYHEISPKYLDSLALITNAEALLVDEVNKLVVYKDLLP